MVNSRRFRFGVHDVTGRTRAEFVATARKAEALGYATLLLSDHVVGGFAPMPALAVAAEATTTLRVASLVFDNDFRHPAVLAKEAATLDVLSEGRFELGIGAGWHLPDYEQTGIRFDPPAVRVSRLEESLRIIKGFFAAPSLTHAGTHYTITNLNGDPKPVQQPHPPIYIGAGGRRLLSIAAREADIIGLSVHRLTDGSPDLASITAEGTTRRVDWVRKAAGERFNELELSMLCVAVEVTDDRWKVGARLADAFGLTAMGLSVEQALQAPQVLVGTVDQIVDGLQERRERFGISYIIVYEKSMNAFAPIVARLAGT